MRSDNVNRADHVSFECEGQSYVLRFDINALCDLEDQSGIAVNQIGEALGEKLKLGFVRACFWAGLRQSRPDITVAQAGTIIGALGIEQAGELLTRAMTAAFPSNETGQAAGKAGAENPPSPQPQSQGVQPAGTGTAS